jgi:hypothetical protein
MKHANIFAIRDDEQYRLIVIDSVCSGVRNSESLKNILNYVLDKKLHLFEDDIFQGSFYESDDDFLDLILPSIRRVWAKFFIETPEILTDYQKELYRLSFDIDEFIDYLLIMIPKVKTSLFHFDELDRTLETLTLIVDNYVAKSIRKCIESQNILEEIRDKKITKIVK